ncbi:MAG TPA: hypothetical protein VG713_12735, partial [Pirellulales bacterium]|nr:hypothetical protein [Pirellulales bacterium]
EFYVADIGWVPADVSSAVLHDAKHEGMNYFGRDNGDFLVLHVDPDIEVETLKSTTATFQWLQGFHYYVLSDDGLKDVKLDESWTVASSKSR